MGTILSNKNTQDSVNKMSRQNIAFELASVSSGPSCQSADLYGLDLEVESDEGEHKTLEILDQVVETPAKEYKTKSFKKLHIFM
jgi:hypothetical protein